MANSRKLSLQEEIERDVQKIEKEIAEHQELEQIQVTEALDAAILSKIKEYEKEKAEEEEILKLPEKKVVYHKKKKIRWFFILAAVFVLVLGVGMTSVGSKPYWKELLDVFVGDGGSAKVINVEDMDKQKTEDIDEVFVYQEIKEKLGITPVEFRYKPELMVLKKYEIDEQLKLARLFFAYEKEYIMYTFYASNEDSSWIEKDEDKRIGEYSLKVNNVQIQVEEVQKPKQEEMSRIAKFEYQGVCYELKGQLGKEEFDKILENLYFW